MPLQPPGTVGGLNQRVVVASGTNADITQVSVGPSQLLFGAFGNTAATPAFIKFYDNALTSTSGAGNSGTLVGQAIVPGNTAGAGSNLPIGLSSPLQGLQFASGIAFAITPNIALSDASGVSASSVTVWIGWR